MRRHFIATALCLAAAAAGGCYEDLEPAGGQTAAPAGGAGSLSDTPRSSLGKAKGAAESVVDQVEQQQQQLADEYDRLTDPDG